MSTVRLRNSLVFVQLMTSFVLLSIALLIVRQTDYLLQRDTGFDARQVMVVNTSGMPSIERITFKQQLTLNQQVINVSMCSTPPGESLFTFGLVLPGASGDDDKRLTFYHMFVDENFIDALGVDIKEGRFFSANVPGDSLNAFVVNHAGAEAIHDSLMTRQIEIPNIYTGTRSSKTIVGVIDNFHFASFHTGVEPLILEYNPKYARYLLVRFHPSNAKAVVEILERMWKENAPLLPLHYYFLDESFGKFYATEHRTKQIVIFVSILAVCLASLGIFGTSLFALQQRTKEIGVRKLLGSATTGLFILLFRPIFIVFVVACAAGIPIALWLGEEWLAGYPYRTSFNFIILLISFATMLTVMLLTLSTYIFKISKVQPAEVLKSQ